MEKICEIENCNSKFHFFPYQIKLGKGKYCSKKCANIGISKTLTGRKQSQKIKKKRSHSLKGYIWPEGTYDSRKGDLHHKYIKDRKKLKKFNNSTKDRRSYAYSDWRKQVWERDLFKCQISNKDCKGRIEAHHILRWSIYPELRYDINNGITLCHAHHPRKKIEEDSMVHLFQRILLDNK